MIKRIIHFLRFDVWRRFWPAPPTPYEWVKNQSRYQRVTVSLFGKPFTAHDGAMFHGQYREIIKGQVYRFACTKSEPVIVDCGSNCGLSIVYFKRLYPDARITGVEADPTIYSVLGSNIAAQQLSGVRLLNGAVSGVRGKILFHAEGSDSGRTQAIAGSHITHEVDGIPLDDLIDERVDFLKIDIEGEETNALLACTKLARVDRLFVEYHSFVGQSQTLDTLLKLLKGNGFRYYLRTVFCPAHPFLQVEHYLEMDLQLNIYAVRDELHHG